MIEADTLPSKIHRTKRNLAMVPEAVAAGWRGVIDCSDCVIGHGAGRAAYITTVRTNYFVFADNTEAEANQTLQILLAIRQGNLS